jgi:hypothetical protein
MPVPGLGLLADEGVAVFVRAGVRVGEHLLLVAMLPEVCSSVSHSTGYLIGGAWRGECGGLDTHATRRGGFWRIGLGVTCLDQGEQREGQCRP